MRISLFSHKTRSYQDIQPDAAKEQIEKDKNTVLLDVRTPEEHRQRHIPGSRLLPLANLQDIKQQVPDTDNPVIVYCQSGSRSARAAEQLTKMGFTKVYNLGGINRWPYPTQSGK